jgi:cytochrome c-type biogenesis protein CcmH/NrfF
VVSVALWLIPVAVCAAGAFPLVAAARRMTREMAELQKASSELGQLRPAMAKVRQDANEAQRVLKNLRLR